MVQPEVTVDQGTLRGTTGTDTKGDTFYKFQGIPYATPPLGNLRFKAPQPPKEWSGILDATKEGNKCYSRDPLDNNTIVGSEDCLYLNVYTKKLTSTQLSPVLFWIHGGGLHWGHGGEEYYGPDFLVTEDVVLVTFNYRLGMLGLLSLEDPSLDVPGNAGLKDQVMALKWVQRNISKFGGDPNNVTIFGESAGAGSVHLHVLSPMSKGLFHRAIAQSGCALNPWIEGVKGVSRVAPAMGLDGSDEKTIFAALAKMPKEEILAVQDKMDQPIRASRVRALSVVVETGTKEPFLPDEPIDIIKSGRFNHVPFMLGYTTAEGIIMDMFRKEGPFSFEEEVPRCLGYHSGTPETKAVAQKIKHFYFGSEPPKPRTREMWDFLTDIYFLYGIHESVKTHLEVSKQPIYLYRMSIETELNFFKKMAKVEAPGVAHLDDVGYLFKNSRTPEIKSGSLEEVGMTRFVKLWSNFARLGNPTPDKNDQVLKATWKPATAKSLDFLDIGESLVPGVTLPERKRVEFWERLYDERPAGLTHC